MRLVTGVLPASAPPPVPQPQVPAPAPPPLAAVPPPAPMQTSPVGAPAGLTRDLEQGLRRFESETLSGAARDLGRGGQSELGQTQATTVQVLVNDQGAVLSTILLTSSGLAAADQRALELAREATFAPTRRDTPAPALAWGRLVFQWVTRLAGGGQPVAGTGEGGGGASS